MSSLLRGFLRIGDDSGGVGVIETRGLDPVPDQERYARPTSTLWTWTGANIGVLGITVGAVLVATLGLNWWQAIIAALLGAAGSYLFVGLVGMAGPLGGAPSMALSRAVFGVRGNLGPAVVSWIVLIGAETMMCATATSALMSILGIAGLPTGPVLSAIAVVLLVAGAAVLALFGHATIVWLQKWMSWIFGGLTLILLGYLLTGVDWTAVTSTPGADLAAVASGIGYVAVGSGIMRLATGPDYSRYLPDTPGMGRSVLAFTVIGATVPLTLLISVGSLLAASGRFADGGDAVGVLGSVLPEWLLIPYLLVVMVSLLTAADLTMYSASFSLQASGAKVSRRTAVIINAALIAVAGLLVAVFAQNLFAVFTMFISVLAVPLTAWAGVFLIDLLGRSAYDPEGLLDATPESPYWFKGGFHWPAAVAWVVAIVLGLLCVRAQAGDAVWFAGPLADTWVGRNQLGWLVAGVSASAIYWILEPITDGAHRPGRAHEEL